MKCVDRKFTPQPEDHMSLPKVITLIREKFGPPWQGAGVNPLAWALESITRRGLLRTSKVACSVVGDIGFDIRYGTDTMRWVEMKALNFESEHKVNAASYRATKAGPLRKLMHKLDLPKDGVFVDLGSGKGRVLLIAAQVGFEKIIGVEFSRELCEIARENVKAFAIKTHTTARIEVVESDVASYRIEPAHNVFFIYNPFGEVVMTQFLANLRRSVTQFPHKIWLIYNTPIHHKAVSASGLFSVVQEFEIRGTEFRVYNN
jgi:16S rRNA G966 N2-methylase RsmD